MIEDRQGRLELTPGTLKRSDMEHQFPEDGPAAGLFVNIFKSLGKAVIITLIGLSYRFGIY